MPYIIGIDTGGTFTDCVVMDAEGRIVPAKASSTPDDFSQGVMESLRLAGERLGITTEALLRDTARLALGTTVGTNAMLQRRGAKVGLITTRGHRDVIHIMRGARGVPGLNNVQVLHFPESGKPDPIVPKPFIAEVSERVDCKGQVVVELNEEEAEAAIRKLVAKGVESIAICFLWSFKFAEHERRVKAMVERLAPNVFVCCSADLIPRWGEYERTVATVLNAYLGPVMSRYLGRLESRAQAAGLRYPLQVMQCGGGVIPAAESARRAFLTLDSGPVAGVLASQYLGAPHRSQHVIATDMGGTSFDVGLVWDGEPVASYQSVVHQYEYFVPRIDIRSIGSGGGSIVWIDEVSGTMRVARSRPVRSPAPPATAAAAQPTVTDADLVLGYLDPGTFLGGRLHLDVDEARQSFAPIATRLPWAWSRAPRARTRGRPDGRSDPQGDRAEGYDPRDCVVYAYGGAGPVHAGVYARAGRTECGGAARRSLLAVVRARRRVGGPPAHLRSGRHPVEPVRPRARDAALRGARGAGPRPVERRRHRTGRWPAGALGGHPLQGPDQRGRGAGPIWNARRGRAGPARRRLPPPVRDGVRPGRRLSRGARGGRHLSRARLGGQRQAAHRGGRRRRPRAVAAGARRHAAGLLDGAGRLRGDASVLGRATGGGNVIVGPAIIQVPDTTIVVHPFQTARIDPYGNVLIDLGGR
jgi:N-methylhydantoinase A/oxoprolinase/acetone carboxylase beta subunit